MIKNGFVPEDESQVPIFPPELLINGSKKYFHKSLIFKSEKMSWFRPTTIQELLHLKMNRPNAKIVNGNTELGIEMKFKNCKYPIMIHPSQVNYFLSTRPTHIIASSDMFSYVVSVRPFPLFKISQNKTNFKRE